MNQLLMEKEQIKIRDLYEGAYLLCRGFQLKELTIIGTNGKKIATFIFTGEKIRETAEEYRLGRATANIALLKFSLNHLKDKMFEKIREIERAQKFGFKPEERKICSDYPEQKK